jgi:hypothetical protein
MRLMTVVASGALLLASASAPALEPRLDTLALRDAIRIGVSGSDVERERLHAQYRVRVAEPPVDWIDVMTPFHRVMLAAEQADGAGLRFGQREAIATLGETADQLDVIVELTFHPLNTFVAVPTYSVRLEGPDGARIEPRRTDHVPRFSPRVEVDTPAYPAPGRTLGEGQPVLGGTIVAAFGVATLDAAATYQLVVADGDAELTRVNLDLGRLR